LTTHLDRSARPPAFTGPTRPNRPLRPRSFIAHQVVSPSESAARRHVRQPAGHHVGGKAQNLGCLSFVRLNSEINYSPVARIFPRGVDDPDRFIWIEVKFEPDLDAFFGVRNVKRAMEPQDDLRKQIRTRLAKYVPQARHRQNEMWGQNAQKARTHRGEHADVMNALKEASRTLPRTIGSDKEDPEQVLEELTRDVLDPEAEQEDKQHYRESS
jgi:hypothetical protein